MSPNLLTTYSLVSNTVSRFARFSASITASDSAKAASPSAPAIPSRPLLIVVQAGPFTIWSIAF